MKTSHTQGNWKFDSENGNTQIFCENNTRIICEMQNRISEKGKQENEANAKLISCAPELLKSLQLLINDIERNDGDLINRETLLNEAKQLIEKATK